MNKLEQPYRLNNARSIVIYYYALPFLLSLPASPLLAAEEDIHISDFTRDWAGIASLIVFAIA